MDVTVTTEDLIERVKEMTAETIKNVYRSLCLVVTDPVLSPLGWDTPFLSGSEVTLEEWAYILQWQASKKGVDL